MLVGCLATKLCWSTSCGVQDALAQEIETGAAVHAALHRLRRLTCPSTGPLLHGSAMAARTAASSWRSPVTKPPTPVATAASSNGVRPAGSPPRRS